MTSSFEYAVKLAESRLRLERSLELPYQPMAIIQADGLYDVMSYASAQLLNVETIVTLVDLPKPSEVANV